MTHYEGRTCDYHRATGVPVTDISIALLESFTNKTIEQLNNETVELDISHLPARIYFDNEMIVKKIIKP